MPTLGCSSAGRGKGLRPFPHTPFSASGSLPPLRSGQIPLDHPDHFPHNQRASVASLRRLIGFLRKPDRLRDGITVRLQRNPHQNPAFVYYLLIRDDVTPPGPEKDAPLLWNHSP
jgi:hypothetical protein